jgi:hypothetical protein
MMLKFREIYKDSNGFWGARDISVNPRHIVVIKENTAYEKLVREDVGSGTGFDKICTIVTVEREIVVLGEVNELQHHVKGQKKIGRTLLHG